MKSGIELITEERQRQIEVEGWTAEHDQDHDDSELALAAVAYAMDRPFVIQTGLGDLKMRRKDIWPFEKEWFKPSHDNRIKDLTRAGALIAAEIDRLQANNEAA